MIVSRVSVNPAKLPATADGFGDPAEAGAAVPGAPIRCASQVSSCGNNKIITGKRPGR